MTEPFLPATPLDRELRTRRQPRLGRREKLADQVARLIEERILDGSLAPGEQLPIELEIAADLNVSRTVVRDAIRALASRRLVDVRQGIGTMVTSPSPDAYAEAAYVLLLRSECTVGDLVDARQLLDSELIIGAMRAGGADWSVAESALADYWSALQDQNWDGVLEAHNRYHLGLLTSLRNPVIDLLMAPMHEILLMTAAGPWTEIDRSEWVKDYHAHPPIFEAVMRNDESALREAVRAHYGYMDNRSFQLTRQQLLRRVAPMHGPLARTKSPGAGAELTQLDNSPRGKGFLEGHRKGERRAGV